MWDILSRWGWGRGLRMFLNRARKLNSLARINELQGRIDPRPKASAYQTVPSHVNLHVQHGFL